MNELTIKHIGEHYQYLQEYPFSAFKHLAYSNKLNSSDLIKYYLDIQECNWFFNHPNITDTFHYIYLNGKNLEMEKVVEFKNLEEAEEYLVNFKKEIEYLFDEKGTITI